MNNVTVDTACASVKDAIDVTNREQNTYQFAIIGAGFGGICAAVRLRQAGYTRIVIFERSGSVGGTWRDNRYPGCACDVPSVLYSLSFALNPNWERKYAPQAEIYAYLKQVVKDWGILPYIRFHTPVTRAEYDEAGNMWRLHTPQGTFTAQYVISAVGAFSTPAIPNLPGLDSFSGTLFHSAQWPENCDLRGKRVAVIGTGATAAQVVPSIAPEVSRLYVFQRTPAWVVPRNDKPIPPWKKRLRATFLGRMARACTYLTMEAYALYMTRALGLRRIFENMALRHLERQVTDPELRRRLTPTYAIACKRIILSDDFYPALQRPNVTLVTEGIEQITPNGIRCRDGREFALDAIILCTGFHVTDNPLADTVFGRGGRCLGEVWQDGPEAYLGTLVNGFPNYFMLSGPNTGIGHTSLVFMMEVLVEYVLRVLRCAQRYGWNAIEVTARAQRQFNDALDRRMQRTVWASGCRSWYIHPKGRVSATWPGTTISFWWRTLRVRVSDFEDRSEATSTAPTSISPVTEVH